MTDLLAVLDMSEVKQCAWLQKYAWHHRAKSQILEEFHRDCKSGYREISFADLAFRLRDEVIAGELFRKMITVHEYCDKGANRMYSHTAAGAKSWFIAQAKPIHWIIASLIAKGETNEDMP